MVIVKFIQDGLKCQLEGETDTYKYSKNMEMQFVKDENHQDYEVTVFFLDQEKNEGKIDIDENGVFKVGERFFLRKEPFYLSFQLEKGDEIQHLGNYKMRVCDAIGNGSSPLPEDPKIWIEYVDEEMDKYFNENFQPKLDKFNADYEEIKKIAAGGGSGSSITVDSELNSTSKNPVQNKVIKAELDKKAAKNEIPTNLSSLNEDETHQTVTAEEKKKWDGKSDFDGDFNNLNNIPNIPDAVIVDAELNETSTNAIQNQAVAKELAEKLSKNGLKTINGQSLVGSGNIELSAGDNDYELPIANNETLGGVQPVAKTEEMTQQVGVDELGALYAKREILNGNDYVFFKSVNTYNEDGSPSDVWTDIIITEDENSNPLEAEEIFIFIRKAHGPYAYKRIKLNNMNANFTERGSANNEDGTLLLIKKHINHWIVLYTLLKTDVQYWRWYETNNFEYSDDATISKIGNKIIKLTLSALYSIDADIYIRR